jgi:hypothetical protein
MRKKKYIWPFQGKVTCGRMMREAAAFSRAGACNKKEQQLPCEQMIGGICVFIFFPHGDLINIVQHGSETMLHMPDKRSTEEHGTISQNRLVHDRNQITS